MKNNIDSSHSNNIDKKNMNRQSNASFERKKDSKETLKKKKRKLELERQRKKLENIIEKKLVEADKKEQKQREISQKKLNLNATNEIDLSNIPAVSLKEFNREGNKEKKESALSKFFNRIRENRKIRQEKRKAALNLEKEEKQKKINEEKEKIKIEKLEKKKHFEEQRAKAIAEKKEKARLEEERKAKKEAERLEKERIKTEKEMLSKKSNNTANEEKQRAVSEKIEKQKIAQEEKARLEEERKAKKEAERLEKEEKQRKIQEEKTRIKQEKLEKKRQAQEEKARIKQEKLEKKRLLQEEKKSKEEAERIEKERIKAEQNVLTSGANGVLSKEELIAQKKKQKELLRQKKDEERKKKLAEKYEQEVKRKKELEDKKIIQLNEKKEKARKIQKEKEAARKERKEKALLIKKAQEESRQKARSERKTLQEKVTEWYNNLSIVKDRKNRRELQRQTLLIDFDSADAVRSEEKIMYKYVAKSAETGKVETGYFAAFSKLDVHSFLMSEGYEVYEITPQKSLGKNLTLFSPKFKATELDFFLTQLSTFLKSGMTLVESVKILAKQSKKRAHKNIYKSIIYELTMGENFSEALAKQGTVFPRLLINMIKTSELTGDLPETLDDMANYYKETDRTRRQMKSAISYPLVVLVFAAGILVFIMVKVIPQFVSIYANLESGVPPITRVIINVSEFLQHNLINVFLGIIAVIILFIVLFKNIKVFKSVVQTFVMNLPIIGKIIIYNEVTMFTKTFASLLNHNVYITDSMEVLSKITNNEVYKMLIFDTITNLAKGEAISNSFKNHWAFPNIAYEMILTGEKTGQLGTMMDKVANYYDEQHKNAVNQIKAFIEPVMIIILAAMVGVILLSIVIPMFDMYQNIASM